MFGAYVAEVLDEDRTEVWSIVVEKVYPEADGSLWAVVRDSEGSAYMEIVPAGDVVLSVEKPSVEEILGSQVVS